MFTNDLRLENVLTIEKSATNLELVLSQLVKNAMGTDETPFSFSPRHGAGVLPLKLVRHRAKGEP